MNIILLSSDKHVQPAAEMALSHHRDLRILYPWLPEKVLEDYIPRIEWMMKEGRVFGLMEGEVLTAFLGWFRLDNFRNAGPGALTPDWCSGTGNRNNPEEMKPLVRKILGDIRSRGLSLHGFGLPAHREDLRSLLSLTGYGHIVMDAASPQKDLLARLEPDWPDLNPPGNRIRILPAQPGDGKILERLDLHLAAHIAESPVLMPETHGDTAEEWESWLADPETVTFLAKEGDTPVGFIKGCNPQFDVSFTVHGPSTLSINGLWVDPSLRRQGTARRLLLALVREAEIREKDMISVDCETMNPEAYAFWSSHFRPVSWSLERRF